ncbi:MAG: LamG domain-containing protein [Candidatus Poribacteria bacterium]|nr:LamG domain-containing protein [Candidatus Poribacteria bacterium]
MYRVLTFLILSLFALIHLIATQVVALDTDGLVGAWLFDEGKGEAVTDSSDNGLDGKIAKGKPKWVDGKFDGAMEFGGQDMVTVDDDNALDLEEFTIAAWVNIPKVSGAWQIIATKENRNPTGRNYGLFGHINSGVVHYSFTTNSGWKSFDAKTVVTDGDWHHVAGTYDGSDFKFYLDGAIDAQVAPGTKPDNHDNFLFIGGCDIGNYWMTGTIDEVVLYDRALSEKELNELMEDGMSVALDVQPGGKLVTTWSRIKTQ